jgi:hypothetical protein
MNPRRFPRTMQEAWGPYTSNQLEGMREPMRMSEKAGGVLLAIAGGLVFAVLLFVELSK